MADRLDQLAKELLTTSKATALVVSRQPQRALAEAMIATQRPLLVTVDAPEAAVRSLTADYSAGFADAVRRTANSIIALLPLMKHARVLHPSDLLTAERVAAEITRVFDLGLDDAAIRQAVQDVPERPREHDAQISAAESAVREALAARAAAAARFGLGDEMAATTETIASGALQPVWSHLNGKPLKDLFWHPALFCRADDPAHSPILPMDTTGTARCLMFGPYMHLPEGSWRCNVMLGCAENTVGVSLVADVFAGVSLNTIEFTISDPGLVEIEMSFVNPNPDMPVEVRLFSSKACFEGELMFGGARLMPQRARIVRHG